MIKWIEFCLEWEELIDDSLEERKQTGYSPKPTGDCSLMKKNSQLNQHFQFAAIKDMITTLRVVQ